MADGGQSAQVVATVRHRLKTVVVRDDMIGWVQAGTKTLHFLGGTHTWRRGELFLLQRGTQWDVENDPAPDGHYRALVLAPGRDLLRAIPADAARPVAGCASHRPTCAARCRAWRTEASPRRWSPRCGTA